MRGVFIMTDYKINNVKESPNIIWTNCPILKYEKGQTDLLTFTQEDKTTIISLGDIMTLKETRLKFNLSQIDAANIVGVPVRTFRRYEIDDNYGSNFKRSKFIELLNDECELTEEKGLLSIEQIKKELTLLFDNQYKGAVEFCYLFGSYAKGYATEKSDVDLCISSSLTGVRVAGLAEAIRGVLHKKIDLIRFDTLKDNLELINEIMKDGVKIYG